MRFFGCIGRPGHHMWTSEQHTTHEPWFDPFDGKLVPIVRRTGEFALHHLYADTLTVLAFVDYTVDTRPGSNGAFIEEGDLTIEEMCSRAWREFPHVAARVGLPVAR